VVVPVIPKGFRIFDRRADTGAADFQAQSDAIAQNTKNPAADPNRSCRVRFPTAWVSQLTT
jgi:hypothetical protein